MTTVLMLGVALYGCGDDRVRPLPNTQTGSGPVTSAPTPTAGNGSSKPSTSKPSSSPADSGDVKDKPADDQDDAGVAPVDPSTPLREDGDACRNDKQCASGHCSNRLCCSGGDCCNDVTDCAADDNGEAQECHKPKDCQGRRGAVTCKKHVCTLTEPVNDDTACGNDVVASDCGLYADVKCSGEANQEVPACATSCNNDNDCDTSAHCERNKCVADRGPDADCSANAQCMSNSCFRGKCCAEGDCCEMPSDCPASYTKAATCDDADKCQGSRGEVRCNKNKCETEKIDDDSGCGWWTPSKLCGQARRLTCPGGTNQQAPSCGDGTCFSDAQCDNSQHCGTGGRCVDDVPNGESCDRDALCASNHCNNGLCCDGGTCCRSGDKCADSARCVKSTECQGERYVNECMDFQCKPVQTMEDDSVCVFQLIDTCGTFADLRCTADRDQDTSSRMCPRFCVTSFQCDPGLQCAGAFCVLPPPPDTGGGGSN